MSFIKDLTNRLKITYRDLEELSDKYSFTDEETELGYVFINCKNKPLDALIKVQAAIKNNLVFFTEPSHITEYMSNQIKTTIEKNFFKVPDGFLIGVTSGTTSKAKFVYSTRKIREEQYNAIADKLKITSNDVIYNARGTGTTSWTTTIGVALSRKASLLLNDGFSYEDHGKALQKEYPTVVMSTPPFLSNMFHSNNIINNRSIRIWYVAGSPISTSDALEVEKLLDNGVVVQACSRTEGCFIFCSDSRASVEKRIFTIGTPHDKHSMKLVNDELYLKKEKIAPLLIGEYDFTNDGWYATGDLLSQDGDGYYIFKGRKKLLLNCGATDINPLEVEELVDSMDGVEKSYCVGITLEDSPHTKCPCLAIMGKDFNENDIMTVLNEKLNIKLYKTIEVDCFPMTYTGKIDRQELTKILQDREE